MCGRFTLTADSTTLAQQFALPTLPALAPRYNIAPTQPVAAVRVQDGQRELALLRWGLVPHWAKDTRSAARMINARAETVAEKPAFRAAFTYRRCLIPASGFYEWQATADGKHPHYFQPADPVNSGMFAFAGLWEQWAAADGSTLESCTIITTAANATVQPIHERMPVILPPTAYATWLDPTVPRGALAALLQPYPASAMQVYPVSSRVNSPRNDDAACTAPVG